MKVLLSKILDINLEFNYCFFKNILSVYYLLQRKCNWFNKFQIISISFRDCYRWCDEIQINKDNMIYYSSCLIWNLFCIDIIRLQKNLQSKYCFDNVCFQLNCQFDSLRKQMQELKWTSSIEWINSDLLKIFFNKKNNFLNRCEVKYLLNLIIRRKWSILFFVCCRRGESTK